MAGQWMVLWPISSLMVKSGVPCNASQLPNVCRVLRAGTNPPLGKARFGFASGSGTW